MAIYAVHCPIGEGEAAALERSALAALRRGEREGLARSLGQVAASLGKTVGGGEA